MAPTSQQPKAIGWKSNVRNLTDTTVAGMVSDKESGLKKCHLFQDCFGYSKTVLARKNIPNILQALTLQLQPLVVLQFHESCGRLTSPCGIVSLQSCHRQHLPVLRDTIVLGNQFFRQCETQIV